MEYATSQLPQITILPADATYLLWIYCKEIPMNSKKSARLLREKTGLYLSAGTQFSGNGASFWRMNIACPRSVLQEGLERLKKGLQDLI